jgi:hypothetical protein
MRVSKSLAMIHYGTTMICYFLWTFPCNDFGVVYRSDQASSIFSVGSKGHTTFLCGLFSLDFGGDFTHTSSLYVLCLKVKPWSFLVLENSWLALKLEINFPCCWDAGVCSFALLFNPYIPKPSQFISHEETDEQSDWMDFYPSAWPFASKCELSTLGLLMVLRGPAQCQK